MDVQSVMVGNEMLQISYLEERDVDTKNGIIEIRTLEIPLQILEDELVELQDVLQSMVDKALLLRRNPPARIRG